MSLETVLVYPFRYALKCQPRDGDSSGKSQRSPADSRAGAQNIGPNSLDCCETAARSCPRAARRLPACWLPLVRRRVISECALNCAEHVLSHRSIGDSCLSCEATVAGAHARRSAQQRYIDRGGSDQCSERQRGRCGSFSCVRQPEGAGRRVLRPSLDSIHRIQLYSSSYEQFMNVICIRPAGLIAPRRLGIGELMNSPNARVGGSIPVHGD